jgi:hypothetical protein
MLKGKKTNKETIKILKFCALLIFLNVCLFQPVLPTCVYVHIHKHTYMYSSACC